MAFNWLTLIFALLFLVAFIDRRITVRKAKDIIIENQNLKFAKIAADEIEEKKRIEMEEKGAKMSEWMASYDNGELVEVYTDSEGNKWFTFADIKQIPAKRGILAELTTKYIEMNITPERLNQYVEKMLEHVNQGHMSKVATLLERLNERLKWNCEEETLLQFAKIYFMMEGEPITGGSIQYGKRKDEILRNDLKARAFFLLAAFKLTRHFSDFSEVDILAYLKEKAVATLEDNMILSS